jgi:hypothetical protein
MYQPYPSAGQVPEPVRPEPPSSVLTAVKLMYAGAVVSAVSLIVSLATLGSLRSSLHKADASLTPSQLHSLEVFVGGVAVLSGLIGIGLWLWMAWANKGGKAWARIVATVLFGVDTLILLLGVARAGAAAGTLVSILTWLIGLAAVVMLWRRDSSAYFNASRVK